LVMCCMQVTGDSIFNLLALADIETDKDDRPVYEQKILSVEVVFPCHICFSLPYLLQVIDNVLDIFCWC
jgi:hypothetical protein